MSTKRWVGTMVAVAMTAVGLASSQGCGTDVASCGSVCGLPGAPATCATQCTALETACAANGCSGDVQAFLTCVGNAGTYSAVTGLCAPEAATVAAASSVTPGQPVDGGGGAGGACATATCASVCAPEGSASAPSCTSACEVSQASCPSPGAFQAFLTCLCEAGGLTVTSTNNVATLCAGPLQTLSAVCPSIGVGSTGTGSGGGVANH